ncbi:MAG TPA: prepilin peptidase [candidate division Zixibacteria bacterium]|nr:prepilin peptidase [candidate division Zixibacteria bacterium]
MVLAAAALGFLIGSFLNVVIARLPRGTSLWRPGSSCPVCGARIAWHDNIPVLSFVLLRGRCRACRAPISWQYPAVELATGALFGGAYLRFGLTPELVLAAGLLAALVAVTVIDLQHQIIPDAITLPGVVVGVLANAAIGRLGWIECGLGILVGGGIFWLVLQGSLLMLGQEGLGGGDIKLGAMLGAFLGWKATLLAIVLAVVGGGLIALVLLGLGVRGRKDPIPFGPFLAIAGAVALFWGEGLIAWYLHGTGF